MKHLTTLILSLIITGISFSQTKFDTDFMPTTNAEDRYLNIAESIWVKDSIIENKWEADEWADLEKTIITSRDKNGNPTLIKYYTRTSSFPYTLSSQETITYYESGVKKEDLEIKWFQDSTLLDTASYSTYDVNDNLNYQSMMHY